MPQTLPPRDAAEPVDSDDVDRAVATPHDPRPIQTQLALGETPADDEMSRAEWLAVEEVPVIDSTSSPHETPHDVDGSTDADHGLGPHWRSFRDAARDQGHGSDRARMLHGTMASVDVDGATGVAWMREGFTPWGASVWIDAGVDDPSEAHELRRWHLSAEEGYWARRDGITQRDLQLRRALIEWMATSLAR